MLAEALMGLERPAQAEPHLRRITQLAPKDPAAWFNLGQAYEDLAGQSFHDLLEQDPESAFALALVGEVRLDEGQRAGAFQLYRRRRTSAHDARLPAALRTQGHRPRTGPRSSRRSGAWAPRLRARAPPVRSRPGTIATSSARHRDL